MATNYNDLVEEIKKYFKRTDDFFISQIPNFIQQAVNLISREAKNIGFEKDVIGNLAVGNPTVAKPADWKETVSIRCLDTRDNTADFLKLRTREFCQSIWPNSALTSRPEFYADSLAYNRYYFAPTPDFAYQIQITYLYLLPFNQDNPTNFLTIRYEDLLLFACLKVALIFLKDDQRIAPINQYYMEALQSANEDAKKLYMDRTSKRDVT